MDPARHNHPGIPYDFFSGYILMIADNMDQTEQQVSSYGSPPAVTTTTIVGKLPDYVIQNFLNNIVNIISSFVYIYLHFSFPLSWIVTLAPPNLMVVPSILFLPGSLSFLSEVIVYL